MLKFKQSLSLYHKVPSHREGHLFVDLLCKNTRQNNQQKKTAIFNYFAISLFRCLAASLPDQVIPDKTDV